MNCFFRDADKDFTILCLAFITFERQPVCNTSSFTMRAIKLKKSATDTAITDQVITAPNTQLKQVLRCAFKIKYEAFGPLWLHSYHTLRFPHDRVENYGR